MTEKLYIIGNGFDLRHGVPSSYGDFGRYVAAVEPALHMRARDFLFQGEDLWSDFEAQLASLDTDLVRDSAAPFLVSYGADDWSDAYHHDYQYEINEITSALSKDLKQIFARWVAGLEIPDLDEARIAPLALDRSANFLNFNYTPTLSELYGVGPDRILHIHGSVEEGEDSIVLGHGWRPPAPRQREEDPGDPRFEEGENLIEQYFRETFKPTHAVIRRERGFFDAQRGVKELLVLGHSMADVDLPYFRELLARIDVGATWTITYHGSPAAQQRQAASLGLDPTLASFVTFEQLQDS